MTYRVLALALTFLAGLAALTSRAHAQVPEGLSSSDWSSIRGAYEDARHRIVAVDGGLVARSHRQQYVSRFDGRGVSIEPDEGEWSFGLEFIGYGRGDEFVRVGDTAATSHTARRVEHRWDERVTEWYVNGADGLEHGFVVSAPTTVSEPLEIVLAVRSGLSGMVDAGRLGVTFVDERGAAVLHYRGLLVVDAMGTVLDAHVACSGEELTIHVDDTKAVHPIVIDPIVQQAYLKASNASANDLFGSVAIDGETVVVGAYAEGGGSSGVNGNQADSSKPLSGAAYVFVRSGSTWVQQAYLKASNTGHGDRFGWDVDIDGDTIVVGAIYEDSFAMGVNGDEADDTVVNSGAAYVFVRNGSTWVQQAYLKASNTESADRFGWSVAVDADTIVVAADGDDSDATGVNGDELNNFAADSGSVFVFTRNGTNWSQQAYLKASNTGASDGFGLGLDISADTVVVGARYEHSNATGVNGNQASNAALLSGAAYVFVREDVTWTQQAYLKASNTGSEDAFGASVAIDADTIVVGAPFEDSNATGVNGNQSNNSLQDYGAAYVFTRSGTTWSQHSYLKASNSGTSDVFGSDVAIDDGTIVVGASGEKSLATGVNGFQANNQATNAGAAYVFVFDGTAWAQLAYLKASNTDAGDGFGASVGVDGDLVVVGAGGEDSDATNVDGDQSNDTATSAGAVYVFDLDVDWRVVPGCHDNTGTLALPTAPAQIGTSVPIHFSGTVVGDGIVATYYGVNGSDGWGCGFLLAPGEEALLKPVPFPTLYAYSPMSAGQATTLLTLPNNPAFVGFFVTLQSVAIELATFTSEFSNGIEFVIRP